MHELNIAQYLYANELHELTMMKDRDLSRGLKLVLLQWVLKLFAFYSEKSPRATSPYKYS